MGFEKAQFDFDSDFTVFVGENGSGKTSVLEAIRAGLGRFLHHQIVPDAVSDLNSLVRVVSRTAGDSVYFEEAGALEVQLIGTSDKGDWQIETDHHAEGFSFSEVKTNPLRKEKGLAPDLALLGYYQTNRASKVTEKSEIEKIIAKTPLRKDGYAHCFDSKTNTKGFSNWMAKQETIFFQEGVEPVAYRAVKKALTSCLPKAKEVKFLAKYGCPVVEWEDESLSLIHI